VCYRRTQAASITRLPTFGSRSPRLNVRQHDNNKRAGEFFFRIRSASSNQQSRAEKGSRRGILISFQAAGLHGGGNILVASFGYADIRFSANHGIRLVDFLEISVVSVEAEER